MRSDRVIWGFLTNPLHLFQTTLWAKGESILSFLFLFQNCGRISCIWIKHTYNPAIPLTDIYPRKIKAFTYKKTCAKILIASLFIIIKTYNLYVHQWRMAELVYSFDKILPTIEGREVNNTKESHKSNTTVQKHQFFGPQLSTHYSYLLLHIL